MKSLLFAFALPALAVPAAAAGPIIDHAAVDRAIESFTGSPPGAPGGATAPIDRRLRLAACDNLAISWRMPRRDTLVVECGAGAVWKFFVPIVGASAAAPAAAGTSPAAAAAPAPIVVSRNEIVTVEIRGSGFTVSQSGQALEAGAIGGWIKVKMTGKGDVLTAQVIRPGLLSLSAT